MKRLNPEEIVVTHGDLKDTYKSEKYYKLAISKYEHLFPLIKSKELARITACLITDGFMDIRPRLKSTYYGYIGFFSKDEDELKEFSDMIYHLFQIKGVLTEWGRERFGESKGYIIKNSVLTRILNKVGIPGGGKVNQKFGIPRWIFNSNKAIKSAFLRQLFDCEGSISYDANRKRWEIRYAMYKSANMLENCKEFLSGIQKLLNEFGIKSHVFKKEAYTRERDGLNVIGLYIRIDDRESVINYFREIGFGIPHKREKLKQAAK